VVAAITFCQALGSLPASNYTAPVLVWE